MAYQCQNFKPGQILTAGCMNNIDEWLEYICGKEIREVTTNELGQLEITFCNGEVLNCGVVGVTVEHIEESVKDGGKNIIHFSDGTEVVIRNGNKGTSGVHFGADAPPSNATIWINPNGEPTSIENWEFDLEDGNTEAKTVVVLGSNDSTDSDKLPLLKVKDENGNWVEIPAIKGFDPIVETSKSGKVSTIRITTSDGVKTVTVNDGADLTVTNVSESSEDGGENVVTFSDGNRLKVKNGKTGYTPQKNVDYFDGTSVSVANVSESTEDGGSNVVNFSDGKGLTVKNGKTGGKGDKGDQGFGWVTAISRPSWIESQWATYGEVGHIETWSSSATDAVRNGCRFGDIFAVFGTATDTGNAHIAYYRSLSDSGDLYGTCIAHSIATGTASMKTDTWTATYEDGTVETIEVYVK